MTALDKLGRKIRQWAKSLETELDHDDDWNPIMWCDPGKGNVVLAGLDPNFMRDPEAKNVLAYEVMPQLIRESGARRFGFITTVWMVIQDSVDEQNLRAWMEEHGSIGNHPQREEYVMLLLGDNKGRNEQWLAKITRRPDEHPILNRWKKLDVDAIPEGRFHDSLMSAIQGKEVPPSPDAEKNKKRHLQDSVRETKAFKNMVTEIFLLAGKSSDEMEMLIEEEKYDEVIVMLEGVLSEMEGNPEEGMEIMNRFRDELFTEIIGGTNDSGS